MTTTFGAQRDDIIAANQTVLTTAIVLSFTWIGSWIYNDNHQGYEPIWIRSLNSFSNFIMKISYMDGKYDYLWLTCKIIYVIVLIYYFSMLKILKFLDDRKCKVLTYTTQFRQVIGTLLLGPFLLAWFMPNYSIVIFLTAWICALGLMIVSLQPESYNMLLQLNQLLAIIPIVIGFFWFCNIYFSVPNGPVHILLIICEALVIAYLVNIVYVSMFTKEVGYYCMDLHMPDRKQDIYQKQLQQLRQFVATN